MSNAMIRRYALVLPLLVSSCVAPLKMHEVDAPLPATVPGNELANGTVRNFSLLSKEDTLAATGILLDGIRIQQDRIAAGEESVIPSYNYLVSRFIKHLERSGIEPWTTPVTLLGRNATYTLGGREPAGFDAEARELVPSDMISFTGSYARDRVFKPGIGAPLVAHYPETVDFARLGKDERFDRRYRTATAIVRVTGNRAVIEIVDPYALETVSFAGKKRPLAADFGSAACLAVCREKIDSLGLARLLNPARYDDTARLSLMQPYDPKRTPVLMIHGLQDTPATWIPMYLELMKDPAIRRNYQFWAFSYPSGYPYPYSASLLRKELARMRRDYSGHKDIVLIGHSMGGVISRLMAMNTGDTVWREYFGKAPSETKLTGQSRQLLKDALIFNHEPDITRVIFLSAPHGGSDLASNWIGRLGSKLVRAPAFLADISDSVLSVLTVDEAALQLSSVPNSIDTLAPNNRFVRSTRKLPIHPGIPYHSIMGDRGKGDTPDSSDGVVPYWSSHLGGETSEKIVPSNHSSHQHPQGIEEVNRILRQYPN